jgi:outer membrane immunogenic protein
MRIYLIAGALAAGVLAAPAFAAPAAPFAGGHVEILAGYDKPNYANNPDGLLYGLGAGYDFRLGEKVRLGIEIEATDSTAQTCLSNLAVAGDRLCLKSDRDLYIGGRIGTMIGPRTLLYAKAGYSNYRVGVTYDPGPAGSPGTVSGGSGDSDGVRFGAGAEFALSPSTFIKAEYRFSSYEAGLNKHQALIGLGFRF